MQVDFMIIGAQKCGTTTLAQQLSQHAQICFCSIKEPGHFNRDDWRTKLDDYHALYTPEPGQLCGEGSTMYTFIPEFQSTYRRLHEYNPELKLIYVMRHPVERIVSNYAHRVVRSTEHNAPENVIFADPVYLNRSRYGMQLRPYLDLFGPEQILLLLFEEYIADQPTTLVRIADFLGISADSMMTGYENGLAAHQSIGEYHFGPRATALLDSRIVQAVTASIPARLRRGVRSRFGKKLTEKPRFSTELKQVIWQQLEEDVAEVEQILGRRLDHWREGYTS